MAFISFRKVSGLVKRDFDSFFPSPVNGEWGEGKDIVPERPAVIMLRLGVSSALPG